MGLLALARLANGAEFLRGAVGASPCATHAVLAGNAMAFAGPPKNHGRHFVPACTFAKHLKAIRWETPFEAVRHAWTTTPEIPKPNPRHDSPGPCG